MKLQISDQLTVSLEEIKITQIRAQGAGGQNVNKVSSAVQLHFDIESSSLAEPIKGRLLHLRDSRITKQGTIVIKAQNHRTYERNKEEALDRLAALIRQATIAPRRRKKTRPSRRAKEKRLEKKTQRGMVKKLRQKIM